MLNLTNCNWQLEIMILTPVRDHCQLMVVSSPDRDPTRLRPATELLLRCNPTAILDPRPRPLPRPNCALQLNRDREPRPRPGIHPHSIIATTHSALRLQCNCDRDCDCDRNTVQIASTQSQHSHLPSQCMCAHLDCRYAHNRNGSLLLADICADNSVGCSLTHTSFRPR